jgi:hypothetical protein
MDLVYYNTAPLLCKYQYIKYTLLYSKFLSFK